MRSATPPDVLVTDKLRSYGAAKSEMKLSARHEQGGPVASCVGIC
jgi:transposase-like protein